MLNRTLARQIVSVRNFRSGSFQNKFNQVPPKKVYWGSAKLSGEAFLAAGAIFFFWAFDRLARADFLYSKFHMSASHFQMDNIIIVDGKYRYIPTKMHPAEHEKDVSYMSNFTEYDWTPTDGKGI
ncbi:Oidioi.mRNA.OKI2018_I69.XSR.g14847.t1.cds [Oikopleura dioica]|uniref:Oidioi.mRNA.OKI2018_I69.XSR.g14847.t1.cds n=1 Tax=Oikopleura dioica TaxID=34765 RepID=A0ABN7SAZ2_OIKDI|nr:Oidioi.mRNA.OKI2018_I69.XSR.g14847.t1.cds [Oikopleura dioica]